MTLLALVAPGIDASGVAEAARAIGAVTIATTPDQTDVTAVVRRLDSRDVAASITGEGEHWREAGYWLVPFLALLSLLWFRRGWVLA